MNPSVMQAQLAQAQAIAQKLMSEREQYIRLTILLSKIITEKQEVALMDGHVCVKKSMFDAVPKAFRLDLKAAELKDEAASDPNAPGVEMIVVMVGPAPERPVLVRANGKV